MSKKKSRMEILDECSQKLSGGKVKTFEETCMYDFESISKVVYYAMNKYAQQSNKK